MSRIININGQPITVEVLASAPETMTLFTMTQDDNKLTFQIGSNFRGRVTMSAMPILDDDPEDFPPLDGDDLQSTIARPVTDDEIMAHWRGTAPWRGTGLPHISYIARMPEPRGIEHTLQNFTFTETPETAMQQSTEPEEEYDNENSVESNESVIDEFLSQQM